MPENEAGVCLVRARSSDVEMIAMNSNEITELPDDTTTLPVANPQTPQESPRVEELVPQRTGNTLNSGTFAVDGLLIRQEDHDAEAPIPAMDDVVTQVMNAVVTREMGANDEYEDEVADLIDNPLPSSTGRRSRQSLRQKTVLALSLEMNLVSAVVLIFLLVFGVIVQRGSNDSTDNQSALSNANVSIPIPTITTAEAGVLGSQNQTNVLDDLPDSTLLAMERSRSPQSKAYQWLIKNMNNKSSTLQKLPKWRLIQRFALAIFYYSTRGEHWVHNNGWLDWEINECEWEQTQVKSQRVTLDPPCNDKGEIRALIFQWANKLEGTIPPEVGLLGKSLESVVLTRQLQLKGSLPTNEVGLLTRLTNLNLGVTGISGALPTELGLLRHLSKFSIVTNQFHGCLPTELGKLEYLQLFVVAEANLSGYLPNEIYQFTKLEVLAVQASPKLNTETMLQGIAASRMPKLKLLSLQNGPVEAEQPIPSELGLLTTLTMLSLIDLKLHGTIPSEFGCLLQLTSLALPGNSIVGNLPRVFSKITSLQRLDISSNRLVGTLPPDLFSTLTQLQYLLINDNDFVGLIPTEIGFMSSLKQLHLENTNLSGTIPSELLELKNLTSLVVTNTFLLGRVPDVLCGKLFQIQVKCFGQTPCLPTQVKGNTTGCQGTSLCGCDCAPC
eukprot:Sro2299_g322480.1 STYKc (669) ;mRNA; r:9163-11486